VNRWPARNLVGSGGRVLVDRARDERSGSIVLHAGADKESVSGGPAFVAMVQSADLRKRDDAPLLRRLHPPALRSIFVQTKVTSAGVIVSKITFENAMQMSAVQHQHMVQALAPNGANEPLHIGRLPKATGRNSLLRYPQGLRAALEFQTVLPSHLDRLHTAAMLSSSAWQQLTDAR